MRRSAAVPLGRTYLAVATLATTAGLTAACGNDPVRQTPAPAQPTQALSEEDSVYCADEEGNVVDDDECDDNDGRVRAPYFLWVGPFGRALRPGAKLSGGQKFPYNDAAARSQYGLPSTGRVTNGTAVTGGFGKGTTGGSGSRTGTGGSNTGGSNTGDTGGFGGSGSGGSAGG